MITVTKNREENTETPPPVFSEIVPVSLAALVKLLCSLCCNSNGPENDPEQSPFFHLGCKGSK